MKKEIYIVGMGPGNREWMTSEAIKVLEECDVIVGYTVYVDLLRSHLGEKEYITTPMKREIERCELCFSYAEQGKKVALVCSGDAGVYGMAAPMYTLSKQHENVELCVIPGITAANSGAAELGAPLNHDYCVISLSDLLTKWEVIERRLRCAIEGDFCIAIYNPSSKKRADYLKRACDIMLEAGAMPERACGYVENIGRKNTKHYVCTLKELRETQVNMFTTVFIGNSETELYNEKMITKRGYRL